MNRRIIICLAVAVAGCLAACSRVSPPPDTHASSLVLRELGNRLAIRDSASSWNALVQKLKPTFTWNGCDMLWIENDTDGRPQFVLDEAYVYQPTNQPLRWVLLDEHSGETDDAYRQVMGNNLRGVAHLCPAVPEPHDDAGEIGDYAVVLSQNPALGTVYEIGWQQLMSAGTGHRVNNRRIYLYRDSTNDWHFLGEGIGVGNSKSGCCETMSTDVSAHVDWLANRKAGIPLEIKFRIRHEDVQRDESGKSHSDVSFGEAALAGNFPAEVRENEFRSGDVVAGFQLAVGLDETNGVLHCRIQNTTTNQFVYSSFDFGYFESVRVEIQSSNNKLFLETTVFPPAPGFFNARPSLPLKIDPGEIITNTYWKTNYHPAFVASLWDFLKASHFHPVSALASQRLTRRLANREAVLSKLCQDDTFALDLTEVGWPTNFLSQGSLQIRIIQRFNTNEWGSGASNTAIRARGGFKMNSGDTLLYSPAFTWDAAQVRSWTNRNPWR